MSTEPAKNPAIVQFFTHAEAQMLVQMLERSQAQNKEMVVLKHAVMAKLIPMMPEDPPQPTTGQPPQLVRP